MSQAKESQVDDDDSGVTTYDLIEALQRMVMNSPSLGEAIIGVRVPKEATDAFCLFYPNKINVFYDADDGVPEVHFVIDDIEVLNKLFRGALN